jgi:Tol biopolymer transport system component
MSAAGGTAVQVSNCANRASGITWRYDSTYLVYECQPSLAYLSDLWKVLRTGGLPVNLTANVVGSNSYPSMSPDGQWIAFSSLRSGSTTSTDIYKMDFAGNNATRLTTDALAETKPEWSPDGAWILYEGNGNTAGTDNPNLFRMKPDGTGQVIVHAPDSNAGQWSPDSTKVVSSDIGAAPGVVVMAADGSNPTTLSGAAGGGSPSWSPDSARLVFQSAVAQTTHVFVGNANATGYADLTPNANGEQPAWQPVCH